MPDLSAQMDAVCHRFEELSVRLNQPDAAADPALFRKLMRDYHETQPVVQAYRDWQTARDHLAQAKALLEEPISDPDFKQMIQQEISEKSQDVAKLENNLKILLLPRDPRDEKNVIMNLDKDGNLPGIDKCFKVDAISTSLGALFGMPSMTTYLESSAGVEAGGNDGKLPSP